MLALTAWFGWFARDIKVDSSVENLLPSGDPDRVFYEAAAKQYGDEEVTLVGIFADDIFTPATLAKIRTLSDRVAAIDGVHEVLSLATVKAAMLDDFGLSTGRVMRDVPKTAEEAAALRARVLSEPLYVGNVVSADGRAAGMTVVYDAMSDDEFMKRDIEGQIRAIGTELTGPERFAVTGVPTVKVHGARLMETDTARFTPLALLLVIVVLAAMFRTARGVVVPVATVLVAVTWTTGIMVLLGSAINMGTIVLTPLLIVIGVASGIHLVSEYYLQLRPDRSARDVVHAVLEHVRAPIAIAALTTLIGFAALIPTPIQSIRDFGIYSVIGILVVLLASFTVAPALLVLMRLPRGGAVWRDESPWLTARLQRIGRFSVSHSRAILVGLTLVGLWSLWGITRLRVETDYISFFSPKSVVRTDNALVTEGLGGTQPFYVVLSGEGPGAVTKLEALTAMQDLEAFIREQPGVDKTISLLDYLHLLRRTLRPETGTSLPDTQAEVGQLLLLISPEDVRGVVAADHSQANILVRTRLTRSGDFGTLVDRIQAYADEHLPRGLTARATGTVVLLNRSADEIAWGQVAGLWQELLVLLVLLAVLFLSIRVGVLALIPNVYPTLVLFGIMGWTGIPLNVSTCMIAAIAIGIAIDDTIHLLSTFNEGLRETGSQEEAIIRSMSSAGRAAVFIAVALAAGFLIVCLSNFQPIRHFGILSATTMGVSLVTELLLTPALLTSVRIITLWDLLFLKLGPAPQEQIPLFAGLRPFQAKIAVLMARLASAARGVFIARHGEAAPEMYVLLEGRAEVRRPVTGRVVRTLARGDVIGEMGLVRRQPRTADVVAVEDSEYLVVDERFLGRLRSRYPRIGATVFFNLARILSDRLEKTTGDLDSKPDPGAVADVGATVEARAVT